MYYLIHEKLTQCEKSERKADPAQYVVVLTKAEWAREKESFDMGIEIGRAHV